MPIQYRITDSPRLLHIHASGKLSQERYFEAVEEWVKEEKFHPSMPVLFEVDDDAELNIDEVDLAKAEESGRSVDSPHGEEDTRIAYVGGDPDLRSFMMMAQEILNDKPEVRSFESLANARQWLLS